MRTAVSRRPTAFSSAVTSPTAGLPGMTDWMTFWAGLAVAGEGLSDGPPVPAGGAMSWHAVTQVHSVGSRTEPSSSIKTFAAAHPASRRHNSCRAPKPAFSLLRQDTIRSVLCVVGAIGRSNFGSDEDVARTYVWRAAATWRAV